MNFLAKMLIFNALNNINFHMKPYANLVFNFYHKTFSPKKNNTSKQLFVPSFDYYYYYYFGYGMPPFDLVSPLFNKYKSLIICLVLQQVYYVYVDFCSNPSRL